MEPASVPNVETAVAALGNPPSMPQRARFAPNHEDKPWRARQPGSDPYRVVEYQPSRHEVDRMVTRSALALRQK